MYNIKFVQKKKLIECNWITRNLFSNKGRRFVCGKRLTWTMSLSAKRPLDDTRTSSPSSSSIAADSKHHTQLLELNALNIRELPQVFSTWQPSLNLAKGHRWILCCIQAIVSNFKHRVQRESLQSCDPYQISIYSWTLNWSPVCQSSLPGAERKESCEQVQPSWES